MNEQMFWVWSEGETFASMIPAESAEGAAVAQAPVLMPPGGAEVRVLAVPAKYISALTVSFVGRYAVVDDPFVPNLKGAE